MSGSDLTLLERWHSSRDPQAFRELVARHASMVYATCLRILKNASDAEDVAQDCFLRLALPGTLPTTSLGGWLHRLATYRALDRLKSDARRSARETRFAEERAAAYTVEVDAVLVWVDEAIQRLPETLREPLVLHFLEGRSQQETAAALGVAQTTVCRRIARGVEQLRQDLRGRNALAPGVPLAGALRDLKPHEAPAMLIANVGKATLAGGVASVPSVPVVASSLGWLTAASVMTKVAGVMALVVLAAFAVSRYASDGADPSPIPPSTRSAVSNQRELQTNADPDRTLAAETPAASSAAAVQPAVMPEAETTSADADNGAVAGVIGVVVTGTVFTPDGAPVTGAEVRGVAQGYEEKTTTDDGGAYRLVATTVGTRIYLRASTNTAVSGWQGPVTLAAGSIHHDLMLQPPSSVAGMVVDTRNLPMNGVRVTFATEPNELRQVKEYYSSQTGFDGRFAISAMTAGEFTVLLNPRQSGDGTDWRKLRVILKEGEAREGLRFVYDPGLMISGVIVDDLGEPIADAAVQANTEGRFVTDRVGNDGRYLLAGLFEKPYEIVAFKDGYDSSELTNVIPGTEDVDFVLQRKGGVEGRVVTHEGTPITAFELRCVGGPARFRTQTFEPRQDASGRFRLDHVSAGPNWIEVRAAGYQASATEIEVAPGGVTPNVLVTLAPGRELFVSVTDAEGQAVPDAEIFRGDPPVFQSWERRNALLGKTAADGCLTSTSWGTDDTVVSVIHPAFAPAVETVPAGDGFASVAFVLTKGGSLTGHVTFEDQPCKGSILILNENGASLQNPRSDATGRYEAIGLPAGTVNLQCSLGVLEAGPLPIGMYIERTAQIAVNETTTEHFDFAAGTCSLEGEITIDGTVPRYVRVLLREYEGTGDRYGYVLTLGDRSGYLMEQIPVGDYEVTIFAGDAFEQTYVDRTDITLTPGPHAGYDVDLTEEHVQQ